MEIAMRTSEIRFHDLFQNMPVVIWEGDFSKVKTYLERLRKKNIDNIETYLDKHPTVVSLCSALARIIDVNQPVLDLYETNNKEDFLNNLQKIFIDESYNAFKKGLIAIWNGKAEMEIDAVVQTLRGNQRHVTVRWFVPPQHEKILSRILVSTLDITERKLAENKIVRQNRVSNAINLVFKKA